jgi:hypothetical protein
MRLVALCFALLMALVTLPACQLAGGMAEAYRRNSTRPVEAEYAGLAGKSFAVIASADRAIQSEHPQLVEETMRRASRALANPANQPKASGFVNAEEVIRYTYRIPAWAARDASTIAKDLGGVERLILVEILEYRLNEPGNTYEWAGIASGTVSVYEIDGNDPNVPAFTTTFNVDFPDKQGFGPDELSRSAVTTALLMRMIDRTTWPFYKHEEPYYPEY